MNNYKLSLCAIVLCIIVSNTTIAQSQTQFQGKNNALFSLWYGKLGPEYLGSGAAGIAQIGLSAAALINPAGISCSSFSCYLESSWRDRSNELHYFTNERSLLLPSFASIGIPLAIGSLQLGYARPYYQNKVLPDIPVTTIDHPDGTGEFYNALTEGEIHTGFVGISIIPHPSYSIGISVGLDYIHQRSSMGSIIEVDVNGIRFRSVLGLIAHPSEMMNAGLAIRFTTAKDLELSGNFYDVGNPYAKIPRYEARSPIEIELGGTVFATSWLSFMASAQLEDWSNAISGSHTICQFHLGTEFLVLPSTVIRAGFFTQYSPLSDIADYFDQRFITLGFTISLTSKLKCSLSMITSTWLPHSVIVPLDNRPGDSFTRSELTGGLGFSF